MIGTNKFLFEGNSLAEIKTDLLENTTKKCFVDNITAACIALVRFGVPDITNPRFDYYLQINEEFNVNLTYGVKYHPNSDVQRIMLDIRHDYKPDWYYYRVANDIVKARIVCAWTKLPYFKEVVIYDNDFHLVFRDGSTYKITLQQLVTRENEKAREQRKNIKNHLDLGELYAYTKTLKNISSYKGE